MAQWVRQKCSEFTVRGLEPRYCLYISIFLPETVTKIYLSSINLWTFSPKTDLILTFKRYRIDRQWIRIPAYVFHFLFRKIHEITFFPASKSTLSYECFEPYGLGNCVRSRLVIFRRFFFERKYFNSVVGVFLS